jgi:hypothetical protein
MRLAILAFALLAITVKTATAAVPNMVCRAEGPTVTGPPLQQYEVTDVFRVANGKLYHRFSGRDEYLYNDIREVEPGRYVSGHMVFLIDNLRGYVVIAAPTDWRVVYLDCKRS